jgi:hypothetical protein
MLVEVSNNITVYGSYVEARYTGPAVFRHDSVYLDYYINFKERNSVQIQLGSAVKPVECFTQKICYFKIKKTNDLFDFSTKQ